MSLSYAKGGWEVRWRDGTGRQRSRRFRSEEAAREFDETIREMSAPARRSPYGGSGGVYPYETASGIRWRCAVKRSDGSYTCKRGFSSRKAALDERRRLTERLERGEDRHTRETFADFWKRWLDRRKPYLEPGTWGAYEREGRLRLVPALGPHALGKLGVEHVRTLVDELIEAREEGKLATKTINNSARHPRRLPERGRRGRADRDQPRPARRAPARRARRARLPAPARDPDLPRLVLGSVPPTRRAADR